MCPPTWESRKRQINKLKKATRELIRGEIVRRRRPAGSHACRMASEAARTKFICDAGEAEVMRRATAEGMGPALPGREGRRVARK